MDRGVWQDTFHRIAKSWTQLERLKMHVAYKETTQAICGVCVCVCVFLVARSCPTLCDPMDYSPLGSSVQGISQAILERVAISSSRGSPQPRDQTCIS